MAFAAVIAAAAEAPWRCLAPRVVGAMAMKQMTRDWRTGGFGVANDLPLACSLTFFVGHAGTASLLCCGCPCTSLGICCEGRCPALSGDARGMALEVAGGALPLLMVDLDERENRVRSDCTDATQRRSRSRQAAKSIAGGAASRQKRQRRTNVDTTADDDGDDGDDDYGGGTAAAAAATAGRRTPSTRVRRPSRKRAAAADDSGVCDVDGDDDRPERDKEDGVEATDGVGPPPPPSASSSSPRRQPAPNRRQRTVLLLL
jgi:hypothetical protein